MTSGVRGDDEGGDPACWSHQLPAPRAAVTELSPWFQEVGDGVHWTLATSSDLNANLVHLDPWHEIDRHDNDEVDVLLVVLRGSGHVRIDDVRSTLGPDVVVHLPTGATRSIHAGPKGLWYLTAHRSRGPMTIRAASDGDASMPR